MLGIILKKLKLIDEDSVSQRPEAFMQISFDCFSSEHKLLFELSSRFGPNTNLIKIQFYLINKEHLLYQKRNFKPS